MGLTGAAPNPTRTRAFEPVKQGMRPGDFLLIQFGRNGEKADPARHTDPERAYTENLSYFIRCTREAEAYPVLITSIARRLFDEADNFLPGSHGAYPQAMRELGAKLEVPVADLTAVAEEYLSHVGDAPSKPWFMWPKDNAHLKFDGAVIIAGFLAQEPKRMGAPYSEFVL